MGRRPNVEEMALVSLQRLPEEKRQKALPAVKQGILKRCATTRVAGGKLAGRGVRRVGGPPPKKPRWWFQIFFIFIATWGR